MQKNNSQIRDLYMLQGHSQKGTDKKEEKKNKLRILELCGVKTINK